MLLKLMGKFNSINALVRLFVQGKFGYDDALHAFSAAVAAIRIFLTGKLVFS